MISVSLLLRPYQPPGIELLTDELVSIMEQLPGYLNKLFINAHYQILG